MRDFDRLVAVGASAAEALSSQDEWIHRRVESISFPFANRAVYRRYLSVDFTIPAGLKAAVDEVAGPAARPPRFYVPLSLIRRWPPLPRLDLRDSEGLPGPFLTARQNAVLDSAALQGLALQASREIPEDLLLQIARVAAAPSLNERKEALGRVIEQAPPALIQTEAAKAHRQLCGHEGFCALARALLDNTLLWLRVQGWHEDRAVVKFSYDVPIEPQTGEWSMPSFGLAPFNFKFEVPHLGDTSSYHCNVTAPAPLEVVRAELKLGELLGEEDRETTAQVRHHVDSTNARPHSDRIELFAGHAESQAKFYASGDRTGLHGNLWVAVLIQSQGLLRSALGVGLASVVILLAFTAFLHKALSYPEAAVAVLLISPAILGYLSLRPREEALAGGFLVGLRRLIMLSGVPPVLAATTIALSEGRSTLGIYWILAVMTVTQMALLGSLTAAYVAGNWWRAKYKSHPDAHLTPH